MCEYCENGKNIELTSDSAKSYWFIMHRNGTARLYCKMGESQLGNAYGIEISHCPMCGRSFKKEIVDKTGIKQLKETMENCNGAKNPNEVPFEIIENGWGVRYIRVGDVLSMIDSLTDGENRYG